MRVWEVRDSKGIFAKYISEHSDILKKNMMAGVSAQAGLGKPPRKFYTNQAESVNFRIKCAINFREKGLLAFIKTMWDQLRAQEEETKLAFCNMSKKCAVRREFEKQLLCTTYFSLPVNERRRFLQRARSYTPAEFHSLADGTALTTRVVDDTVLDVPFDETGIFIN